MLCFLLVQLRGKGSNKLHLPTNKPMPLSFSPVDSGVADGDASVYGCGDCSVAAAGVDNNTVGSAAGGDGTGTGGDGTAAGVGTTTVVVMALQLMTSVLQLW